MFAKSQSKRTSLPIFPALPIVVALSFSLTLQALAQSSATSQAGTAATTNSRTAATTKATSGAGTAADTKSSTQSSTRATTAADSKATAAAAPATGTAPAKAGTDAKAATDGTKKKKKKEIEIVKSKVHESTNSKAYQTFPDYIQLKAGQENLPLQLTVENGPDETAPMASINADLAGRRLFTQKNFGGKRTLKIDMTNALAPGPTQIVFTTFGAKGAKFSWKLTSNAAPTITKIEGTSITPGSNAKASGTLLPSETNLYTVKVGGAASSVVSVTDNKSLEFKIPKDVKANDKGEVSIEFTISGQKIKALTAKLVQPPEIKQFSHVSVSAGTSFTIQGKNLGGGKNDKVRVTFNGTDGTVLSASDTSITVMPPDIQNIPSSQTVAIEVNGVKCKQEGVIQFSMFATSNDGSTSPFKLGGAWSE